MIKYTIHRLLYGYLVIWGVVSVVFLLFHVLPGDPVALMAGNSADQQTREAIRQRLGMDRPLSEQYLRFLNELSPIGVHADDAESRAKFGYLPLAQLSEGQLLALKRPYLGYSFQTQKPVEEILSECLPGTLWLTLAAMFFASVCGVALGMGAALRPHQWLDHLIGNATMLGMSIPPFVLAILVSIFFGYYLSEYTNLPMTGSLWENDPLMGRQLHLEHIILPALTLGLRPLASIAQLTRASMEQVMAEAYVTTAKAKGLPYPRVLLVHALRNALNPVVTSITSWTAALMGGAFFIEYVFKWKGIGFKSIQAIEYMDLPVIMGSTLVIAIAFVLINLLSDLLYALLDPRVRLS